jgi:hypothetical protein
MDSSTGEWVQTHNVVLENPQWSYNKFSHFEIPVDYASANKQILIFKKGEALMARHLETGDSWIISDLDGQLGHHQKLYQSFHTIFSRFLCTDDPEEARVAMCGEREWGLMESVDCGVAMCGVRECSMWCCNVLCTGVRECSL